MIGRGCLVLANHPSSEIAERRASTYFRRADGAIERHIRAVESPCEEGPLSLLQHTARTLLCRDNPDILASLQDDLHQRTVDTTAWLCAELDEKKKASAPKVETALLRGILAQQVAIGLFTRRSDLRVLSSMALTHHDRGREREQNYDLLLIHQDGSDTEDDSAAPIRATKLQIKAHCLDLDPTHHNISAGYKDYVKSRSAKDITLVSGCCDLRMNANAPSLPIEQDDRQEGASELTTEQLGDLDAGSEHMLGIANGSDTWDRYGTARIRRKPITPAFMSLMERLAREDVA